MNLSPSAIDAITKVLKKYNNPDKENNVDVGKEAKPEEYGPNPVLHLRLRAPERHITFAPGIIDNEHLGRKKSNCCCVYHKPYKFDEFSSSSEDETENCFGHTGGKKKLNFSYQATNKKPESDTSTSAYDSASATISFSSTSFDSNEEEEEILASSDAEQQDPLKKNTTD